MKTEKVNKNEVKEAKPGKKYKVIKSRKTEIPSYMKKSAIIAIAVFVTGTSFFAVKDVTEKVNNIIEDFKNYEIPEDYEDRYTHEISTHDRIRMQYEKMTSFEKIIEMREKLFDSGEISDEFLKKEYDRRIDLALAIYNEYYKLVQTEDSKQNVEFIEMYKRRISSQISGNEENFNNIPVTTIAELENNLEIQKNQGGK